MLTLLPRIRFLIRDDSSTFLLLGLVLDIDATSCKYTAQ